MEARVGQPKVDAAVKPASNVNEYREAIRRLIDVEVKNALDEEIKKAQRELIEEQHKVISQILVEHKAAIRQVVEEEKKAIWEKAEALRKSILKIGL